MRGTPDGFRFRAFEYLAATGMIALLSACGSGPAAGPSSAAVNADDPVSALQRINRAGAECWMRSSDPAFRDLHLVPELDTMAGRPRLLMLKKGKTAGLPVLVIEASGSPAKVETYGPLTATRTGARVNTDIQRWSGGRTSC